LILIVTSIDSVSFRRAILVIRRIVLASVAAASCNFANAADMYVPSSPATGYKDAPFITPWTGFYVGVNGGYGGSTKDKVFDLAEDPVTGAILAQTSTAFTSDGWFGGGQIGYNWQFGGGFKDPSNWVFGIESDIQGAGIRGSATASLAAPTISATGSSSLDWFGTLRGRLGYAWGPTLVYATGGFAYGGVQDKISKVDVGGFGSLSESKIATGYVVGGGIESMFSRAWSVKVEYQYINLGRDSLSVDVALPIKYVGELDANHSYSTVRLGLNYHVLPVYEPLK
jgi:outer membrane immunogenic protein